MIRKRERERERVREDNRDEAEEGGKTGRQKTIQAIYQGERRHITNRAKSSVLTFPWRAVVANK